MGKKRRFISAGLSWSIGPITLTRKGQEFDVEKDIDLIDLIESANIGGLVIEVPAKEELNKSLVNTIKDSDAFKEAIEEELRQRMLTVEPLGEPDREKEKAAAAKLEKARKDDAAAEKAETEGLAAEKEAKTPKVIKDFKAKSKTTKKTK